MLYDLIFLDPLHGFAVGEKQGYSTTSSAITCCDPVLLETVDGGKSWLDIRVEISAGRLRSIDAFDGSVYIGGEDLTHSRALILKFDPDDRTFTSLSSEFTGLIEQIRFSPNGFGWAVGRDHELRRGLILYSEDQHLWHGQENPAETSSVLTDISISTTGSIFAVGQRGVPHDPIPIILKSSVAGEAWTDISPDLPQGRLSQIMSIDGASLFAVGSQGTKGLVLVSKDDGDSWHISLLQDAEVHLDHVIDLKDGGQLVTGTNCEFIDNYNCAIQGWVLADQGESWTSAFQILDQRIGAIYHSITSGELFIISYSENTPSSEDIEAPSIDSWLRVLCLP